MAGHGKSSPRASSTLPLSATGVHHPGSTAFSMQILHFGSGSGLKVRDAQPNLLWKQQLDAAPQLGLPRLSATCCSNFPWRERNPDTPQPLTGALSLSQEGVTLFMLLAAFKTLLTYTGQDDILVHLIANRTSDRNRKFDWVLHQHSSFANCSSNPSFRELLDRVREVTRAFAHQVPFEQLVKQPQRVLSHNLFQVMFVFQDAPLLALELPGLTLQPLIVDSGLPSST